MSGDVVDRSGGGQSDGRWAISGRMLTGEELWMLIYRIFRALGV